MRLNQQGTPGHMPAWVHIKRRRRNEQGQTFWEVVHARGHMDEVQALCQSTGVLWRPPQYSLGCSHSAAHMQSSCWWPKTQTSLLLYNRKGSDRENRPLCCLKVQQIAAARYFWAARCSSGAVAVLTPTCTHSVNALYVVMMIWFCASSFLAIARTKHQNHLAIQ